MTGMNFLNDDGFTTINGGKRALVELTPGELRAAFIALDAGLAGTDDESLMLFGSASGRRAARRAYEKIGGGMAATRPPRPGLERA